MKNPLCVLMMGVVLLTLSMGSTRAQENEKSVTVLMVKGLWWDHFRAEEALGAMGNACWASTWHDAGGGGQSLRRFSPEAEFLNPFNVLMVMNVPFEALKESGSKAVAARVSGGGGLFLFGGPFLVPKTAGMYNQLLKILPAILPDDNKRTFDKEGMPLTLTEAGRAFFKDVNLDWTEKPRVFYVHPVNPTEDATVLLKAGDSPVLMIRPSGKGRIAFFAASVEGDGGPDHLPFWDWKGFPLLVAHVNTWLSNGYIHDIPQTPLSKEDTAVLAKLPDMDLDLMGMNNEEALTCIDAALPLCRTPEAAKRLLEALSYVTLLPESQRGLRVAATLRPLLDPAWAAVAKELTHHHSAANVAIGLELIGALHIDDASQVLLKALRMGASFLDTNGIADQDGIGSITQPSGGLMPGASQTIRLGAAIGLGLLGDKTALPMLKEINIQRQAFSDHTAALFYDEEFYQETLTARLRLGDESAAPAFADVLLKNEQDIRIAYSYPDDMILYARKFDVTFQKNLKIARERIPELWRRRATRLQAMQSFSVPVRQRILEIGADWPDVPPYAEVLSWATPPREKVDAGWRAELSAGTHSTYMKYWAGASK